MPWVSENYLIWIKGLFRRQKYVQRKNIKKKYREISTQTRKDKHKKQTGHELD